MSSDNNPAAAEEKTVSIYEIFFAYLRLGCTAFGMAMMGETKKNIVERRKWISEEEFLNGIALGQLLPGATFVSLTVYIGYRLRGIAGAVASFLGLLLPPFLVMLLLSYLYFAFGELTLIKLLFKGVTAIVVALVANAVWEVGKSAVTDLKGAIIAFLALGVMVVSPDIFLILVMAAMAGILFFYPGLRKREQSIALTEGKYSEVKRVHKSSHLKQALIFVLITGLLVYWISTQPVLLQLYWVFFKMGAFVFGSGYTMIPLIQQEVVTHNQWLTMNEFAVGLALGQITPGPVLITSTFIGYKVAAIKGAATSTLGIFLPSLILVMLTSEVHQKIKHNPWVRAAEKGIVASFVGMMFIATVGLARNSLVDLMTITLAVLAFMVLRLTKIDVIWVVVGGAVIYLILGFLGA